MAPRIDYSARTFDDIKAALITAIDEFLPEWTDRSDTDMGVVILELFAYVGDLLSFHTNNVANEALFSTATQQASILSMAKMLNFPVPSQQAASSQFVFTLSAVQGVPTTIPARTAVRKSTDVTVMFETLVDLVIPAGKLGNEQTVPGVYDYQVEGKNFTQVEEEVVGSIQPRDDGSLDFLELDLLNFPAIKDTVAVEVHNGVSWEAWTRKDLFVGSEPTDKHFTVTLDAEGKAKLRFGNGTLGALPTVGVDNVRANYGFGGMGEAGNGIPVGALDQLTDPIPNVALVQNITASSGGQDLGTADEMKKNMPFAWAALDRAVVEQDYTALAKEAAGIAKASVVFNTVTKKVDVYALPTGGGFLTGPQNAALQAYLLSKSVLGRDVVVKDPYYVDVDGTFEVGVFPNYDTPTVLASVGTALTAFFAFDARDLGTSEFLSNVFALIEDVEGVNFVNIPQFHRVPTARPTTGNVGVASFTTIAVNTTTQARLWTVKMISPTVFEVRSGLLVSNGTLGVAFTNGEIAFTATAGAPAPATNDSWSIRTSAYAGNILVDPLELLQKGTFTVMAA